MPELPEVETLVRGLKKYEGQTLQSLRLQDEKVWFESTVSPKHFKSIRLQTISRRGKYIIFSFEKDLTLLVHLRMTGKLLPLNSQAIPEKIRQQARTTKQLRCEMIWDSGSLFFYDTRRFGTYTAIRNIEKFWAKKKIAPDPIHDREEALALFLREISLSDRPIKALLLDQSVIAGVGNIYADEVLFRESILPTKKSRLVKLPEKFFFSIEKILQEAIEANGTSMINYVNAEGVSGSFSAQLNVYGRTDEACTSCGSAIKKIVLAGRSTHFCKKCQR